MCAEATHPTLEGNPARMYVSTEHFLKYLMMINGGFIKITLKDALYIQ
jgi:hypothetical protein